MNAAGRLGLYAAGVGVAFAAAFGIAAAVVPADLVTTWKESTQMDDHSTMPEPSTAEAPAGVALAAAGYSLSPISAPAAAGESGELGFRILDAGGEPLTSYVTAHDQDLHMIVVRSDGAHFRHVHPELDPATDDWSIPWAWDAAGAYRVYADFVPGSGDRSAGVTLTRTVHVAGEFQPAVAAPSRTASVDGFDVSIDGELRAGDASELTVTVRRDGEAVTTLEPYLGAFGHLVVLREGDLAYLHAHPSGAEPSAGETSGPDIRFGTHVPTAGRYLLYLDFQVDGRVHTAAFVLDAAGEHA